MIESATGLILRTRPLTETSLIVHWLTPDFGRIATVAKGARRPRSAFLGKLDLFYIADLSFSRSPRSDLHTLREVAMRELHAALREDFLRLQQATYGASVIEQTTETETPLPAVYDLMTGFLKHLCQQPAKAQTVFAFELKLLRELGLEPDWGKARLSAGANKVSQVLGHSGWQIVSRLKPTPVQLVEIREFLHGFLIYHLGSLPKGRTAALALHD